MTRTGGTHRWATCTSFPLQLYHDQCPVQASPQHSPVPDPALFFLRRRQLVKYAEHDRNFYDSTRMLNFKVC